MDDAATIQEMKRKVAEFTEVRDWGKYHTAKDLAIGISTEANELLEHFRFRTDAEIESIMRDSAQLDEIEEELADVFIFLMSFANKTDTDLSTVVKKKLAKNEKRYPVEKVKGVYRKYNKL